MKKNTDKKPIIEVRNIFKSFNVGKGKVEVLKDINLEIFSGEFVIIFGPSGCGKSTLLNTLVGLETPTTGQVIVRGQDLYKDLSQDERAIFRSKKFGIVHQQPTWIRSLNIIENVAFPLAIAGESENKAIKRAEELLNLFKLENYAKNAPAELSGGQQQRVTMVRSLITNPWIIVADEPTGNLDTVSASDLMYVIQSLNSESKRTVIMVTHNLEYEKYATKIVKMEDGKIKDVRVKKKVNVADKDIVGDVIPTANEVTV